MNCRDVSKPGPCVLVFQRCSWRRPRVRRQAETCSESCGEADAELVFVMELDSKLSLRLEC